MSNAVSSANKSHTDFEETDDKLPCDAPCQYIESDSLISVLLSIPSSYWLSNLTPAVLMIMLRDCRTDAVLYHLHHRPHQLHSGVPAMESSEHRYMVIGHMFTTAQDD